MNTNPNRSWTDAFADELLEVDRRRASRPVPDRDLVGLAFSGGGIRSATFGLGVLETLKALGRLADVDYLSTVSGGGYIGAWLSAGCHRSADWLHPRSDWSASIAHLRRYSNYLSPTVGFFSADSWSMATIWLRNTLLIQATLFLAIACALLLPRPLFEMFQHWPLAGDLRWGSVLVFLLGVVGIAGNEMRLTSHGPVRLLQARSWPASLATGAVCVVAAWLYGQGIGFAPFAGGEVSYLATIPIAILLVVAGFMLQPAAVGLVASVWPNDDPPQEVNYTQNWVQAVVVIPLMIAAYLMAAILWGESTGAPGVPGLNNLSTYEELFSKAWRYWPFPLSIVFASFWLLSICSVRSGRDRKALAVAFAAPLATVLVFHALLCVVMLLLRTWGTDPAQGAWRAFVWGPPLVALAFVVSIIVLIGMMGRQSTDGVREWWSRLGAWLGIYATAWMVIAVSAVYGPWWVQKVMALHPWTGLTAGAGWIGTVLGGLMAGNSPATGVQKPKTVQTQLKEAVAAIAPFLFIAGLLIGIAYTLQAVVLDNTDGLDWTAVGASIHATHRPFLQVSLVMLGACAAVLTLLAARVDVNEFSLNTFYRNRLVRCYVGASRYRPGERRPQNFTGFDDDDDIPLANLVDPLRPPPGPLHIINCALNLGGSSDLALHTRHSASFTLNPLYCGSGYLSREQSGEVRELGYVATGHYGGADAPTLGQAISVSGAAASPNMGYHTSPVIAFLLTVFNIRLGWWFANPGNRSMTSVSPHFSLPYLFAELFGSATDKSDYVNISDGGHFENLAAYELVRRRCRVIIISDAECDPNLTFEGMGTLIRMCDVDFGVRISIDLSAIRRAPESPWSQKRWAVGSIAYGGGVPDGMLIYVKASMNGSEDTSVLQYHASHNAFPHESTGDQFYGEDQFESYRRLGREIAFEAFGSVSEAPDLVAAVATLLAGAHVELGERAKSPGDQRGRVYR